MKATLVEFELKMPNAGSWNGKWTGSGKKYLLIQKLTAKQMAVVFPDPETDWKTWYYDFGDGWTASVSAIRTTGKEAAKSRKQSAGFCGYEWMVKEIVELGRIKHRAERIAEKLAQSKTE